MVIGVYEFIYEFFQHYCRLSCLANCTFDLDEMLTQERPDSNLIQTLGLQICFVFVSVVQKEYGNTSQYSDTATHLLLFYPAKIGLL